MSWSYLTKILKNLTASSGIIIALNSIISKLLARFLINRAPDNPETYWVLRKWNVLGNMNLTRILKGRQADTYRTLCDAIKIRSVTQVVDLGCNIAALGQLLFYYGWEGNYIGVDCNPYALKIASKALSAGSAYALVCANIRALPFRRDCFNCIVIKDVLEHMEDFRPFLREAARLSSHYVIVANFIPWTEGRTVIRLEPQGYYHNLYNRQEVYSFAHELGLDVEEVLSALESDSRPNEVVIFVKSGI